MLLTAVSAIQRGTSMINAIGNLGITSGLKLCLDAGDANSYSLGQKWLDLSGGGYDFFRGLDGSAAADDPTFNGTVGGQSNGEYFGFDGGDLFTYDSANEAWMENLHKDNAKYAFAMALNIPSAANYVLLISDNRAQTTDIGFQFNIRATSRVLRVGMTNGSTASNVDGVGTVPTGANAFVACIVDEAANTAVLQINGSQETLAYTYSSPSASSASNPLKIGGGGIDASVSPPSGSKFFAVSGWESSVPTAAQMLALYTATRGKYGY